MADFTIKQNDRLPELVATCLASGVAADLTTAVSVAFHMRSEGGGAAKVDAAAVVVNAAGGIVKYSWAAVDTDTSGSYEAEFEVTWSGSRTETFPNNGNITVEIVDDLA
jgi:hypothetical protein